MLIGEMGFNRKEFLHELKWWEINSIIRGYRRRNILQYQLQRMNVWASMFCMGNPKGIEPQELIHLYFDEFEKDNQLISEEEQEKLQQLMAAHNASLEKE